MYATNGEMYGDVETACESEDLDYEGVPLVFSEKRHNESITGSKAITQAWRMKDRMKTVSVALVMCLNVGVDPPDVVKTNPCARLECWIDPTSMAPQKALEAIGASLQHQYERWQPRARYKQSLDPTVDEVKKLCLSLRRNAKEERVLFHYNGHGVPKPTTNGEVWVFNKNYTQYIPLSIYDLQTWIGSPAIYVYDCSNAGIIVQLFNQFSKQIEQEMQLSSSPTSSMLSPRNCIQLAACGATELLPMNDDLPADLFTACLTTPIKMALQWYVLQDNAKSLSGLTKEMIDKIPGQLNDRRTMLGELNWIFTAITDTIAWNTLPRDVFQKLFRQDLLVASLFRNFLLAERIMRSYNCTVVSSPMLPPTYQHPMWLAWDYALDLCLFQLPIQNPAQFQHSPFFADQLTAFEVWLSCASERRGQPEQLPIVLQVLLSQVHRLKALELLARFLDLGPWAVNLALSVGIFPYVLKLLQASARELKPLLVFIWAKILAVDSSCSTDLVKDNGHKYFLSILTDVSVSHRDKKMAAFVLAIIVDDNPNGQKAALESNMISTCLLLLDSEDAMLRQWLALCLGKIWCKYDSARWCGVRDTAHEKLAVLLDDPVPEVRAAAIYALGTFIDSVIDRDDQANTIDHGVAMKLIACTADGSPIVRQELVVALCCLVRQFHSQISAVAYHITDERLRSGAVPATVTGTTATGWNLVSLLDSATSTGIKRSSSSSSLRNYHLPHTSSTSAMSHLTSNYMGGSSDNVSDLHRAPSSSSISGLLGFGFTKVCANIYKALVQLTIDPSTDVKTSAETITNAIMTKVLQLGLGKTSCLRQSSSTSAPNSPSTKPSVNVPNNLGKTPPRNAQQDASIRARGSATLPRISSASAIQHSSVARTSSLRRLSQVPATSTLKEDIESSGDDEKIVDLRKLTVQTEFFCWCCSYFAQPISAATSDSDPESEVYQRRQFYQLHSSNMRNLACEEQKTAVHRRLDDECFIAKTSKAPTSLGFHPYNTHLAVATKQDISIWDTGRSEKVCSFTAGPGKKVKTSDVTTIKFINTHENALLLTGADNGAVSIWRDYSCKQADKPELVTSWQALSDITTTCRVFGLVLDWQQKESQLLAAGEQNVIRIWDVQQEQRVRDIPTHIDGGISSICSFYDQPSLLVAGCRVGAVRMYDARLAAHQAMVLSHNEHPSPVLNVQHPTVLSGNIISCSTSGDIRVWDNRQSGSVKRYLTKHTIKAFEMHHRAPVIACGSNDLLSVLNDKFTQLNAVKYHEGFMGQRIGPITTLAFHPYRVRLAVGYQNLFVAIYTNRANRN